MGHLNAIMDNVGEWHHHQKWGTSMPSFGLWGGPMLSPEIGDLNAVISNVGDQRCH